MTAFKGGGSRSELLLAVSLPFLAYPQCPSFTLWLSSASHPLPHSNTELQLSPKLTSEVAAAAAWSPLLSGSPGTGAWQVVFHGSQARCWHFALLSLILSPSLRGLQFQPAFYTSKVVFRSCHLSLQYLTSFFHCSHCQLADLSS